MWLWGVALGALTLSAAIACARAEPAPDSLGAPMSAPTSAASEREPCDDPAGCVPQPHAALLREIDALGSGNPDFGYATVSPDGASILVYWRGPFPGAVQELADRSASQGTPVNRVEMPYTTEELQGAIIAVVDRFTRDGVSYRSVGGSSDGFVTVSVPDDDPVLQEAARVAATAATDIPVRLVPDEGPGGFDALVLPASEP